MPASSAERTSGQRSLNHGRSSFVLIPSMPAAPAFCSTRLSASARFARDKNCSHRARLSGVRSGVARRRGWTLLWTGSFGLHPPALPPRPLTGLAAFNVNIPRARASYASASRSALPSDEDPRWYYGVC